MSVKKNEDVKKMFHSDSIRRLLKDVRDVYKEPLDNDGIYYRHDENDFNYGYALIVIQVIAFTRMDIISSSLSFHMTILIVHQR